MSVQLMSDRDVLRRTAIHVAVAVCATLALFWAISSLLNSSGPIIGACSPCSGLALIVIAPVLLAGGMSYRSSRLMQELTAARSELWRISRTDQLTGLLNRRGFDEEAVLALAKAHGDNLPAVALMCDIDRFKLINDTFGHEFGDRVLVQIGEVLRSFAQENGMLVGRHGGEEFAALAVGATTEQAVQCAETLRKKCAAQEVSRDGISTHVTVSIGVAAAQDKADLSKMLRYADKALYVAKNAGRNRVERSEIQVGMVAA